MQPFPFLAQPRFKRQAVAGKSGQQIIGVEGDGRFPIALPHGCLKLLDIERIACLVVELNGLAGDSQIGLVGLPQHLTQLVKCLPQVLFGDLGGLVGVGALSLVTFMIAGALLYAILTYVFGIELAVHLPDLGV